MSLFTDASLVLIPSGVKIGTAYSIKPTDGTGDLTFTRSNDTATRVGSDGLIQKVRTNVLLQSETFSNAQWGKTASTITDNATTAPNGTTTADKLIAQIGGGGLVQHRIDQTTVSASGSNTFSVYAKKGEIEFIFLRNGLAGAWFNLNDGSVSNVAAGIVASSVNAGSGWYRLIITKASAVANEIVRINLSTGAGVSDFIGNNTDGAFIWGAQYELNDIATDYIGPTLAAAVSVGPVANLPRLNYLGSSCGKLLLEGQRVNLFNFSEQIDNAYWTKTNSTITANSVTSPDGYTNADTLTASGSGSVTHVITRAITTTSASVYAFSVFVKKGNTDFIALRHDSGGTFNYFNINTGTKGATCDASATIENYGNGWHRCTVFHTATGSNGGEVYLATANGVVAFEAAGQFAYIYGAQYELGSHGTSYIKTLGAAVTRGADVSYASNQLNNIGQTEGTIYAEFFLPNNITSGENRFALSDNTLNNWFFVSLPESGNETRMYLRVGGSTAVDVQTASDVFNSEAVNKVAMAYKSGDSRVYVNGVSVLSSTNSFGTPTSELDVFVITGSSGTGATSTQNISNEIKQALLFKTRLSNADLAALTTI